MHYDDLKDLYKSGKTLKEIALLKDMNISKCYRFLKKEKIRFRRVGRKLKSDKRKAKYLHEKGETYREIAKKLSVSHVTVFNMLKKKKVIPAQECTG